MCADKKPFSSFFFSSFDRMDSAVETISLSLIGLEFSREVSCKDYFNPFIPKHLASKEEAGLPIGVDIVCGFRLQEYSTSTSSGISKPWITAHQKQHKNMSIE